ncbi:MAG: hypothetical protein LBE34_04125 [Flavobacteriaceae bacterium]|jgi:hypothetical protein|nr:hypothetical protein [Flavobacteriaceae bacterium]
MKKFLIKGSLLLCIALATISCSKDDNQTTTPEKEIDKGTVKKADLMKKWRLVKTVDYDINNKVINSEEAWNGQCSTPTTYFLENDKVIYNTYSFWTGKCEINEELDGRWSVSKNVILVKEDWDVDNPNRKDIAYLVQSLTTSKLELVRTWTVEEIAKVTNDKKNIAKTATYYEIAK